MRIRTTKTKLSMVDIQQIVENHETDRSHKMRLKRYYVGKHDILNKSERSNDAATNRIVANFCEYITCMSTGFFLGQPVAYSSASENEDEIDLLQDVFKYNDESAHNIELAEEASITGEAYEVLYMDGDANIRFEAVPSEEVILVCDSSLEENILYALRHYRVYNLDGVTYEEFLDIYDAKTVTHYSYSAGAIKVLSGPEPHYFDGVPIVEYPNNKQHRGDFEGVMTLVDAYDKAQSLTLDDMEDFTDAFLVLRGMGGMNAEDVRALRKEKVLTLEEGGEASWLIKDLNDTYIENIKSRLQKDIHKFSNIPDMSDESFTGNTSGVAIKYKLIGLEQVRSRKERCFKKGLQRRIELISGMLDTKSRGKVDFRDIDIAFTANIPANTQEQSEIVKNLWGLVSQKSLLSLLPFVTDPAAEMDEVKKEREEDGAQDYTNLGVSSTMNGGASGDGSAGE